MSGSDRCSISWGRSSNVNGRNKRRSVSIINNGRIGDPVSSNYRRNQRARAIQMNEYQETRRDFIRSAIIATAALPILANCEGSMFAVEAKPDILDLIKKNAKPAGAEAMGAIDAPATVGWTTTLSNETDKGEPMTISGTVFQSDSKTPAPNTLIYLYHTDFEGYYGRNGQHKHGRYRGWMLTDKN